MTRTTKIILLIFTSSVILSDCRQQKRFKNVEVHGRLIRHCSNLHEAGAGIQISLKADNVYSGLSASEGSIELATVTTDEGGNFTLKAKASKHNNYYLNIKDPNGHTSFVLSGFECLDKSVTEVGDVTDCF